MYATMTILLVVAPVLIGLVVYLIVRIVKGNSNSALLPLLVDVGGTATGVLTCPHCQGASFQCPPAGSRGIIALALGPLVLGALSGDNAHVVECVTCATQFRRGLSVATAGMLVG